jgi:hypothetical protein
MLFHLPLKIMFTWMCEMRYCFCSLPLKIVWDMLWKLCSVTYEVSLWNMCDTSIVRFGLLNGLDIFYTWICAVFKSHELLSLELSCSNLFRQQRTTGSSASLLWSEWATCSCSSLKPKKGRKKKSWSGVLISSCWTNRPPPNLGLPSGP